MGGHASGTARHWWPKTKRRILYLPYISSVYTYIHLEIKAWCSRFLLFFALYFVTNVSNPACFFLFNYQRFTYHTQLEMCVKCTTNCPQPTTTRSSDVAPTPSIPTSPDPVGPVSTRKMINSSIEKPKIEPSVSREARGSENHVVIIVVLLSLLVLMMAMVITWKIQGSLKRIVCENFSCPGKKTNILISCYIALTLHYPQTTTIQSGISLK